MILSVFIINSISSTIFFFQWAFFHKFYTVFTRLKPTIYPRCEWTYLALQGAIFKHISSIQGSHIYTSPQWVHSPSRSRLTKSLTMLLISAILSISSDFVRGVNSISVCPQIDVRPSLNLFFITYSQVKIQHPRLCTSLLNSFSLLNHHTIPVHASLLPIPQIQRVFYGQRTWMKTHGIRHIDKIHYLHPT